MAANNMQMEFEMEISIQTQVTLQKPCRLQRPNNENPIWPPGRHFECDIAENHYASARSHKQYAYKILNWNSKANMSYALETMSSADRRTDRCTDWQGESSIQLCCMGI